ncbi:MAG: protein-glutamate O-methyltransferase CheR, partial [Methylovulum sp.]
MRGDAMNLAAFKALIKQRCGLTFEGIGEAPLVSGLQKRITETGAKNASAYYALLLANEHEFHELVALLTINETYFYREPEQLQLLVDCLIPRILSRKQDRSPVRILCAGCSSGEEPYSIAIALREKYGESAARL